MASEPTIVRGESGHRDSLANTVYVISEHQWAPVCLMVDQFDLDKPGGSRHALAPLTRWQALKVAWGLVKAVLRGSQNHDLVQQPKSQEPHTDE
jgi:hypothetical protein